MEENKPEDDITFDEVVAEAATILIEWLEVISKVAKKLL